jgi:hypothetical protein
MTHTAERELYLKAIAPEAAVAQLASYGTKFVRHADGIWSVTDYMADYSDDSDELGPIDPLADIDGAEILLASGDIVAVEAEDLRWEAKIGDRTVVWTYEKFTQEMSATGTVYKMTEEARQKWSERIRAAEKVEQDKEEERASATVIERMVREALVAVSKYDGGDYCWFELRHARMVSGELVFGKKAASNHIECEPCYRADRDRLLGAVFIGEDEVYIPTKLAFERFNVQAMHESAIAPDDHRIQYARKRRSMGIQVAEQQEVRINRPTTREFWDDEGEPSMGFKIGDISIEGGCACNAIAAWRDGSGVQFWRQYSSSLDPFQENDYNEVDELVADLLKAGRFVTDYRKIVGDVKDEEEAIQSLKAGSVIEGGHNCLLMNPREDKVHGELRTLNRKVVQSLIANGTIVEIESFKTHYMRKPVYAFADSDLARRLRIITKPPKKARDRSKILARDDDGVAITRNDIKRQSTLPHPEELPFNLLPPFDFKGSDDDWDDLQLIEAVKQRRRNEK